MRSKKPFCFSSNVNIVNFREKRRSSILRHLERLGDCVFD
jgi:hypothetical protein